MICKNCSAQFEGKFCPECGTPSEQEVQSDYAEQPIEAPVEQVAEPTGYYYGVPDSHALAEPKKGKKKIGIIIAIIVVVLAAAFCVASFTDLIFSKKAQFSSVISDVFGGAELGSTAIENGNVEAKLSVKLNPDNEIVESEMPSEYVDILNSLSATIKVGMSDDELKEMIYLYENDKELANVSAVIDDSSIYGKADFSDVVFKTTYDEIGKTEDTQKILNMIIEEIKATFENETPEKGQYNGGFDLGADVNTLTVTLDEAEFKALSDSISSKMYEILGADGSEFGALDVSDLKEIRISALYAGAFSFAREALGVSVVVELDNGEKCEIICYSNKENKAIYGIIAEERGYTQSIIATDTFVVNGKEQSGTVKVKAAGVGASEYNEIFDKLAITYTKTEEKIDAEIRYFEGTDELKVNVSAVGKDSKYDLTIKCSYNSEEIGTISIAYAPCEAFEVNIDKSKAIDVTNQNPSSADQEKLMTLMTDLSAWMEEHKDSELLAMLQSESMSGGDLGDLIGGDGGTDLGSDTLEEVLDIREIDFTPAQLDSESTETYYSADDTLGFVNVIEIGYDGDTIKEIVDTVYFEVSDMPYSEKLSYIESMEDAYGEYEEDLGENLVMDFKITGDYIMMQCYLSGLDDVKLFEQLYDEGFLFDSGNIFSEYKEVLVSEDYIKA